MAMIKDANAREMARDAVVLDLGDLRRQANDLKERAEAEAERIVAEAHAERERLIADASEEGRKAGYTQGLEEGRVEGRAEGQAEAKEEERGRIEEVTASWQRALADFERRRDDILIDARSDVLRLALLFARKVTKRVVACDTGVAESQLEAALGHVLEPTHLQVVVHPDDRDRIDDVLPALTRRLAGGASAELAVDEAVGRGGCIVRTAGGEIDATIETQVERIVARLLPSHERIDEGDIEGEAVESDEPESS